MKNIFSGFAPLLFAGVLYAATASGPLAASTVCPSTPDTTSDCNYLITIGATGALSVSTVAGSSAFNGPQTFVDGTTDPGDDGSLVGVINDYSKTLLSFTLKGAGADAGIFDFSFNGICVYTNAAYCATAQSGYEGPTATFSDLQSTVLFETTEGTVSFSPGFAPGSSTYFSIEDIPSDINANGGLSASNAVFATTVPEPGSVPLFLTAIPFLIVGLQRRLRQGRK